MNSVSEAQLRTILKGTEELVRKERLSKIAKDHQSIGAILDNRQLYMLEEPKKKSKKAASMEVDKRLESRRGGRVDMDIKMNAELAIEAFREKGVNVKMLSGSYDLELQLWKSKSSQLSYTQTRRYHFPELEVYKESMSALKKKQFKEQICEKLINIADKYREECRLQKVEMDLNGVFHPEANAHRVHCIYLLKLNKEIKSENIEDVILRDFMAEDNRKRQQEKAEEEMKEKLLKMAAKMENEKANRRHNHNREVNTGENPTETNTEPLLAPTTVTPTNATEKIGNTKALSPLHSPKLSNQKVAKLIPSKRIKLDPIASSKITVSKDTKLKNDEILNTTPSLTVEGIDKVNQSIPPSSNQLKQPLVKQPMSERGGHSNRGTGRGTVSASSRTGTSSGFGDGSIGLNSGNDANQNNPNRPLDKIFVKIKRGKLGGADPRNLLEEEAHRLDKAEMVTVKKSKDRDNLLDAEMSTWMVNSLQKNQINKTATGNANLTTGNSLNHHPHPVKPTHQPSEIMLAFNNAYTSNFSRSDPNNDSHDSKDKPTKPNLSLTVNSNIESPDNQTPPSTLTSPNIGSSPKNFSFAHKSSSFRRGVIPTATQLEVVVEDEQPADMSNTIPAMNQKITLQSEIPLNFPSPTRIIPYEEFHKMFEKFRLEIQQKEEEDETKTNETVQTSGHLSPLSKRKINHHLSKTSTHSNDKEDFNTKIKHDNDENKLLLSKSTASFFESGAIKENEFQPKNSLKILNEMDPKFEAYLKIANDSDDNQYNGNKLFRTGSTTESTLARLKNKLSKPKRIKKMNFLGREAVYLTDSRGRITKDAKKGFKNYFRVAGDWDIGSSVHSTTQFSKGKRVNSRTNPFVNDDNSSVDSTTVTNAPNDLVKRLKTIQIDSDSENEDLESSVGTQTSALHRSISPKSQSSHGRGMTPGGKSSHHTHQRVSRSSRNRLNEMINTAKAAIISEEHSLEEVNYFEMDVAIRDMQDKLQVIWDCLQIPSMNRFAFMEKFSTAAYALEMGNAIDLWGGAAIGVITIQELKILLLKLKNGAYMMPLTSDDVLHNIIIKKIPMLLQSASPSLVPPTIDYELIAIPQRFSEKNSTNVSNPLQHITIPLSALACRKIKEMIQTIFFDASLTPVTPMSKSRNEFQFMDEKFHIGSIYEFNDAIKIVEELIQRTAGELSVLVKRCHDELDEIISVGGKSCKDWIKSQLNSLQPNKAMASNNSVAGNKDNNRVTR